MLSQITHIIQYLFLFEEEAIAQSRRCTQQGKNLREESSSHPGQKSRAQCCGGYRSPPVPCKPLRAAARSRAMPSCPQPSGKKPKSCHPRAPSNKGSSLKRCLGGRGRGAKEQGRGRLAIENHNWVLPNPEQEGVSTRAAISHLQAIWNIRSRTEITTGDVDTPG